MTLSDNYIPAMVQIDAIAIRNIQHIPNLQSVHSGTIAAEHVQSPERCVNDVHVGYRQIVAVCQVKKPRPPLPGDPDFLSLVVTGHELLCAAVDSSRTGDAQPMCAVGHD